MAGKRASMREGPLAALFRSTDESIDAEEIKISVNAVEETRAQVALAKPEAPVEATAEAVPESKPDEAARTPPAPVRERRSPKRRGAPKRRSTARKATRSTVGPVDPPAEEVRAYRAEPELRPGGGLGTLLGDGPDIATEKPSFGRDEPHPKLTPSVPVRQHQAILRVIGVGGAGVNAVNRMVEAKIPGVEFMALNTDLQSLQQSGADVIVHIGAELTRGLGAGADPRVGYKAAFDEQDKIKSMLKGADMVFVTAGSGGGTGTGAAPVVAKLARDVGALTVGIVTKPFGFEGPKRTAQAEHGVAALATEVDTLIVVPNEKLLSILERRTSMVDAFKVADDVLRQAVQGIADLVMLPGLINLDFADVRTTMRDAGEAILGIGMGSGEHRAVHAAQKAVRSPLLETSVEGARGLLLSITGGPDLSLIEASEAAKVVAEEAHPDANIIFGANIDEDLTEQVWVTVIATSFDSAFAQRHRRDRRPREVDQARRPAAPGLGFDIDVPEFIPGH